MRELRCVNLSDILSGLDLVVFCVIPKDLWVFEVVVPPPLVATGCHFLLLAGIDDGRMSLQRWPFVRWMVKIEGALMPRETNALLRCCIERYCVMAQCHERERGVSSYSRGLEEKRSRYGG